MVSSLEMVYLCKKKKEGSSQQEEEKGRERRRKTLSTNYLLENAGNLRESFLKLKTSTNSLIINVSGCVFFFLVFLSLSFFFFFLAP